MATAAKAANTSQSFSSKQSRVQTNLEIQPQPKSPESVRPAPPIRVRCALTRRDPEGPSGQCDNVTESWSMESMLPITTTVGPSKCKHAKARQKAAQRQRLSGLSGDLPFCTPRSFLRLRAKQVLVLISKSDENWPDQTWSRSPSHDSAGRKQRGTPYFLSSNGLVSPLEGDEFLRRGVAHRPRLRCKTFRCGAVRSNNSARAFSRVWNSWRVAPPHSRKGSVIAHLNV